MSEAHSRSPATLIYPGFIEFHLELASQACSIAPKSRGPGNPGESVDRDPCLPLNWENPFLSPWGQAKWHLSQAQRGESRWKDKQTACHQAVGTEMVPISRSCLQMTVEPKRIAISLQFFLYTPNSSLQLSGCSTPLMFRISAFLTWECKGWITARPSKKL